MSRIHRKLLLTSKTENREAGFGWSDLLWRKPAGEVEFE